MVKIKTELKKLLLDLLPGKARRLIPLEIVFGNGYFD